MFRKSSPKSSRAPKPKFRAPTAAKSSPIGELVLFVQSSNPGFYRPCCRYTELPGSSDSRIVDQTFAKLVHVAHYDHDVHTMCVAWIITWTRKAATLSINDQSTSHNCGPGRRRHTAALVVFRCQGTSARRPAWNRHDRPAAGFLYSLVNDEHGVQGVR